MVTMNFKRQIAVFVLIVCGLAAQAQDYCKQIKKEITDNNTSFSYETPYTDDNLPAMRAIRNYSTANDAEFDNFNVILNIPCEFADLLVKTADGESEKEEFGVVIYFDDKTSYKADSIQITHDKKGDGTAIRTAFVPINEDNIRPLTNKKVVKFSLAGISRDVPADLSNTVLQYLICLKNVKKP
jgi:hypothetical protein